MMIQDLFNTAESDKLQDYIDKRIPDFNSKPFRDKCYYLYQIIHNCKNCKLAYETGYHPCIPSIKQNSTSVFIGRNPGLDDVKKSSLFDGSSRAGVIFNKYLDVLGLSRNEVSVLDLCYCYRHNNQAPEQIMFNKCSCFKKIEFSLLKDSVNYIYLMGYDACRVVLGIDANPVTLFGKIYRGEFNGSSKGNSKGSSKDISRYIYYIPLIHPLHLMLNPEMKDEVINGLSVIRQKLNSK